MAEKRVISRAYRKGKKGRIPSKASIFNMVASRRREIVNTLFDLLKDPNPNARLGAAKCLAGKILPDLKATDLKIDGMLQTGVIILPSLKDTKKAHSKKVIQSDVVAGTK